MHSSKLQLSSAFVNLFHLKQFAIYGTVFTNIYTCHIIINITPCKILILHLDQTSSLCLPLHHQLELVHGYLQFHKLSIFPDTMSTYPHVQDSQSVQQRDQD